MDKYNYQEAIKNDVLQHIRDNYTSEEIRSHLETREGWEEALNDELWNEDSVTGNASGSYTFSTWKAEEYIAHNLDLLREALSEFGDVSSRALEKGAEYCDVTIRCYLLGSAISEALDTLEAEYNG